MGYSYCEDDDLFACDEWIGDNEDDSVEVSIADCSDASSAFEDDEETNDGNNATGSSNAGVIILVILLVLALIAIGVVVFFLWKKNRLLTKQMGMERVADHENET